MKSFANGNSGPSHSHANGNGTPDVMDIHSAHWYEFVEGNIHPV